MDAILPSFYRNFQDDLDVFSLYSRDKFDKQVTEEFLQTQREMTVRFLRNAKYRSIIVEEVSEVWNHPKCTLLERHGDFYFYSMNTGMQEQSVIFRQTNLFAGSEVLLDPNELSDDANLFLVYEDSSFSYNGSYFAYCLRGPSDWMTIKIRNTNTKVDLPETLEWVKFTRIAWTHDELGFFYSCYPVEKDGRHSQNHKVFYHRIGQSQEQDDLVAEYPANRHWIIRAQITHSGDKLILEINCIGGDENLVYWANITQAKDLRMNNLSFRPVVDHFNAKYQYCGEDEDILLFRTNYKAPNFRIIAIDVQFYGEEWWGEFFAEDKNSILVSMHQAAFAFIIHHVKLSVSRLAVIMFRPPKTGEPKDKEDSGIWTSLPVEQGNILSISSSPRDTHFFLNMTTYTHSRSFASARFQISPTAYPLNLMRQTAFAMPGVCLKDFAWIIRHISSKTHGRILLKVFEHKKFHSDTWQERQPRPCLLNFRTGYDMTKVPELDPIPFMFALLFNGFYVDVFTTNVEPHQSASSSLLGDFTSIVEFFCANKLTSPEKIAVMNSPRAALFLSGCVVHSRALFRTAIVKFGANDHPPTCTSLEIQPARMADQDLPPVFRNFPTCLSFEEIQPPKSPDQQFPAVLVLVSEIDARINPIPYKFVAALQDAAKQSKFQQRPILLQHYTGSDHSTTDCTGAKIEQFVDVLTFLSRTL